MTLRNYYRANPYVGPRTFTREDANLFYGREAEAQEFLARVISERLVLFHAQAGAGKSSLINTSLIPNLQEEGFEVLPVGRIGASLPAGIDPSAVENIFVLNLLLSLESFEIDPNRLVGLSLGDYLRSRRVDESDGRDPLGRVLIIDQFEEILTTHPERWPDREGFFRQLQQAMAADPRLGVVLSLREEYVGALEPYAHLLPGKLLRGRMYMTQLDPAAALQAARRPAMMAGRPFEDGVAESLIDDLRQIRVLGQDSAALGQFVEPVQLQVVCYQLWQRLAQSPPGPITVAELESAGNVDQSLSEFYEQAIQAVLVQTDVPERYLRDWFDTELITEGGTRAIVFRGTEETAGLPNEAVDLLVDQYLLRTEVRAGSVWVELTHDRLVEPILQNNRAWQANNSTPLAAAAQRWQAADHAPDLLFSGNLLAEAFAADNRGYLSRNERQFLQISREAEARRQAEAHLTAEVQRQRFIRLWAVTVVIFLLIIVVLLLS